MALSDKEVIKMIGWITDNLGTLLISMLLILMVVGIIISMINDKKQGKSSCGGNCANCRLCTACKTVNKNGKGIRKNSGHI